MITLSPTIHGKNGISAKFVKPFTLFKMERNYTELYKLSKTGKPQVYKLYIRDLAPVQIDCYSLITEKGFVGGAMQRDEEEFTEGKNLGRANETTALQQAFVTLNSKKNKLLDKGYKQIPEGRDIKSFLRETEGTDATGNLKPMLAQKDIRKIKFPGYVQRKYDGVRCFTFCINGDIRKVSRNGKPFKHLGHLDQELRDLINLDPGDLGYRNWIIDGELYSHNMSFQNIISSVKREQESNKLIGYRIYDLIPINDITMEQRDRMKIHRQLRLECEIPGIFKHLEIVRTHRVKTMETFRELFAKFISEGYEGAMFRASEGPYEFGRRSYSLIKYKEFDEGEFEIMGAEEATGRDEGTAVFLLKAKNGKWFSARPMGDRELRRDYYIKRGELVGKMGTVKYQGLSDDGIPRFPVFKAVRDYE